LIKNNTRNAYFDKLEALKNILAERIITDLVFERDYILENGKRLVAFGLKTGVSVSNRNIGMKSFFLQRKNECFRAFLFRI
jgi:hypothetical protein